MDRPAKGLALGRRPRRVVVLLVLVHPHLSSPSSVPAQRHTHTHTHTHLLRHSNDSAAGIPAGGSNDSVIQRRLQTSTKTSPSGISSPLNCRCSCKRGHSGIRLLQTRYLCPAGDETAHEDSIKLVIQATVNLFCTIFIKTIFSAEYRNVTVFALSSILVACWVETIMPCILTTGCN